MMDKIQDTMNRHEKAALMFSGGKDSLACLYLLRPWIDKITVIWCNPGDPFPENEALVRKFAATVPHFLEVKTDVLKFKEIHGHPSDIVPIAYTSVGMAASYPKEIKIMDAYNCCAQNIWFPSMQAVRDVGATLIIRGQRNEESMKSPVRSGFKDEEGHEYLFPIEEWKKEDVLGYLESQGFEIPENFHFEESSMDCLSCTAFSKVLSDRGEYMTRLHPEAHSNNKKIMRDMLSVIESEIIAMKMESANG